MLLFLNLLISGGNVGGGATVALGISLPTMPMPCNCSGRSDEDVPLNLPAIFNDTYSIFPE